MRIAATGFVSEVAGSVASANALLLRELLALGHEIDFFSKPSFVDPRPAVGEHRSFRFVPVINRKTDEFRRRVMHIPGIGFLACRVDAGTYNRLLVTRIGAEHQTRKYDVCLWLGDYARSSIAGLPSISFAQGPPGTDARSILTRGPEIRQLSGFAVWAKLTTLARIRLSPIGLPKLACSDHFIVGSQQSKATLIHCYQIPAEKISAMPYPIDMELFCPAPSQTNTGRFRILWLGRIIPRKRLDLFLNAAEIAIGQGLNLEATIVGGIGFAPGYERLIANFRYPERLTWIKNLPREQVPALLHSHSVLVQPSDEENFGSSVAEAQACGLPVIVGHTNGNADYLTSSDIHLQDDTPETLSKALISLSKTSASHDSACSRKNAEACFALNAVGKSLDRVLRKVVAIRN